MTERLILAINSDDHDEVRNILSSMPNLDLNQALRRAVQKNNLALTGLLIESKADVRYMDSVVLAEAINANNQQMGIFLMANGAYIPEETNVLEWLVLRNDL